MMRRCFVGLLLMAGVLTASLAQAAWVLWDDFSGVVLDTDRWFGADHGGLTRALGESHFADVSADLVPTDFAPPAPPLDLSALRPGAGVRFMGAPPGWVGRPHPSPRRQLFIVLSGEMEGTASDGQVRSFRTGQVLLMEDTFGKGHASRVLGDEYMLSAVVSLE